MKFLIAAYRRWKLERLIVQIDREIDGIRAWRIAGQVRERELDAIRAEKVRSLHVMTQHGIERRTADNVRAMK